MGQHSLKTSSQDRKPSFGKRRWTAVVAGAAVIATASTTAWAAMANDEAPTRILNAASSPTPAKSSPNDPARRPTPSPTLKPPAGAHPKPPESAAPKTSGAATTEPKAPESKTAEASTTDTEHSETPRSDIESSGPKTVESKAKTESRKSKHRVLSSGTCGASFYDEPQMTASGERFNPSAMTAAHKTLPLGSKVRVINPNSGASVTVRINDRGPYAGDRCLDLSAAAFSAIGNTDSGVMRVKYEVLAR
ncbi:septal ring lytic transglycosylase RlpA family protein [Nonomuraea sp. NPDC002799]